MEYLTTYSAPPDDDQFKEISVDDLRALAAEIDAKATGATWLLPEWAQDALRVDHEASQEALRLAAAGVVILAAQDEDGWYFARMTPAAGSNGTNWGIRDAVGILYGAMCRCDDSPIGLVATAILRHAIRHIRPRPRWPR